MRERPPSGHPTPAGPDGDSTLPADIALLASLASAATTVEGDAVAVLAGLLPGDQIGEIVAWAWVVDEARTQTVLVDHPRFGVWLPPGGRALPGEHPLEASARELAEETALTGRLVHDHPALVDVVHRPDPGGRDRPTFGVAYLYVADRRAEIRAEPDQAARWWPLDDPPSRRAEHHWRRLTSHPDLHLPRRHPAGG